MGLIDYSKYKVQEANFKFWDELTYWYPSTDCVIRDRL